MKDYVREFEEYLVTVKGVTSNTLESYLRDIGKLYKYADTVGRQDITDSDSKFIEGYVAFLHKEGRSNATITRAIASVRCYYKYLVLSGLTSVNPTAGVKLEKNEKKLPEILSSDEIDRLLSQPDVSDPKGSRDKAMLELLYATGIRVSELISLDITDVNTEVKIINCRGGKTPRCLPIHASAAKELQEYIQKVRSAVVSDPDEMALFTNLNGTRLTRQGFWKIIKYYAAEAGINKDITPHTMRHSLATHMLANGAQLKNIQEFLGHSDISSTQVYAQIMRDQYASIYNQFHPKAK